MTRNQIIASLPALSKGDLAAVVAHATMLTTKSDPPPDWLLSALTQYMIRKGTITPADTFWLRKSDAYKAYQNKSPPVLAWLETLLPGDRARVILAQMAATALAQFLEARGIYCRETMLSQVERIPEALGNQFPGYYEAGMFEWVLQEKDNYVASRI